MKAVIFDCDGTLVDSETAHLDAWVKTFQELGLQFPENDLFQFIGYSDETIAQMIWQKFRDLPLSLDEFLLRKIEHFNNFLQEGLPPIQHTVSFAHNLAANKQNLNLKLGVASAARKHEILHHLKHLKLDIHLDVILSGIDDLSMYFDQEGVNKPKPYIYLEAAKKLNLSPKECIVLEDSQVGVTAARAAGCITIAIPTPLSQSQDFSKAHLILHSLEKMSIEDFFSLCRTI